MAFANFPSCHCHSSASLDTASTAESFAAWELEHGTGALTITDHGTLAGARKVYDIASGKKYKGKLTPILGLESYFRDDDCPLLLNEFGVKKTTKYRDPESGWIWDAEKWADLSSENQAKYVPFETLADYQKYYHLTMHFRNQAAYETAVRLLSFADERAEKHGSEYKPLFGWKQLEEIGAQDTTFTSSCLIGMIQRHVAFGQRYDIAEAYYKKLRSLVKPGNFFVEVFPHICDRNWDSNVVVTFEDGTTEKFPVYKKLKTDRKYGDRGDGIKAQDLVTSWGRSTEGHGCLRATMKNRQWQEIAEPKKITDVKLVETFLQNECTTWSPNGDLQKPCNEFVIAMAKKYGDKILISDDSHFVHPEEKIVQDVKLMQDGNWRFHTSYHRLTSDEAWTYFRDVMNVPQVEFESWIDNSRQWSEMFKGFKFAPRKSLPTSFYPENTLAHTFRLIQKHGRQDCLRDPVYMQRLQAEVNLLHRNGTIDLLPYFFIDEEVCDLYQRNGLLTGPGRGSAAGLLLAYLLEITHVDPIKFGLSMDRFMTLDRVQSGKLPDIDQDLPHRDLLVDPKNSAKGWLTDRFGDCVVQISTDMSIKVRSAVLDVHRVTSFDRRIPDEVAKLAHTFAKPPQGISDRDFVFGYDNNGEWVTGAVDWDPPLMEYVKKYPKEWEIAQKCLGITRGKSRHACAFVIADEPIYNFIPLTSVNGVKVTQPTAAQVESSGGLKMDFLVVNSLNDIGAAIRLIQQRSGDTTTTWSDLGATMFIGKKKVPLMRVIPHKGTYVDIWDLPEDQPVFRSICEGDTESVFQFGTPGAQKWLRHFNHTRYTDEGGEVHKALHSIEDLAAFTALDRPGPLDANVTDPVSGNEHNMLVEFARRARGEKAIGSFPILTTLFPETYGVLVYQEQLQKAFQELGGTTAIEANNFRIHVSKKQMKEVIADKEIFMRGAVGKIGAQAAEQLWQSMETFGQYGFNKSHAVCYVVIGYACAWLKHHYPLEWWTAVLRNAGKNELDEKFWRHCGHLIDMPDISLSGDTFEIVGQRIRAPLNLLEGIGPAAHAEIMQYRPLQDIKEFCQKIEDRRVREGVTVTKTETKTKKKTGETYEKTTTKLKKARTAMNKGVVSRLIVSGAMDSLFPPNMELLDKLQEYIRVNCEITGNLFKQKRDPRFGQPKDQVDAKYKSLNAIQQFQMRKQVLPAYSQDLFPLIADTGCAPNLKVVAGKWRYLYDGEQLPVLLTKGLHHLNTISPWPRGQNLRVAAVAYILSWEKKMYHGTKERAIITLDIEGDRWNLVKWPHRETGKLAANVREDITGALVVAILSKYTDQKPFSIDDLVIVQPPLTEDEEEQSPTTDEGDDE